MTQSDESFLARAAHRLLAAAFLFYIFIGTDPFPSASFAARADGNPLDRMFVLALALLAMVVLLFNRRTIPQLAFRAAGLWIVVAIAVLSILWSAYPGLTLRRSIALVCVVVAAAGVASGVRDLRTAHTAFCCAITAVVVVNLLAILAVPSLAMSEIGAKGIYSQKNVAGMVAMIAVVANATWLARGYGSPLRFLAALVMLGLSTIFLLLSDSKTSLGLTVLALATLAGFALIARGGPRAALIAAFLFLCGSAGFLILLAAYDFDLLALAGLVFGDLSFTGRDELWAFAWRVAMERPWGGHGYGAFWDVGVGGDPLLRMEPGSWLGDVEPGIINQAHNGYLELWLQIGLPAMLLAVASVIALALKGAFICALGGGEPGTRAALAFLAVMPVLFLLHNFTEASLFMRGIVLSNVLFAVLFILARLPDLDPGKAADRHFRGRSS